jgi:hypothetical protein
LKSKPIRMYRHLLFESGGDGLLYFLLREFNKWTNCTDAFDHDASLL